MKKHQNLLLTLISVFIFSHSFAQDNFEFTYPQNGAGNAIEETSDGDFLLKGNNFITKTDADGNELFTTTLANPMEAFNTTSDGGFIKVAIIEIDAINSSQSDIFLVKTDENDQEVWTSNIGDTNAEIPYAVMQTSDGGYLIAGSSDLRDPVTNDIIAPSQICLIKTNATGELEWKQFTDTDNLEAWATKVIETNDSYIVAGIGLETNNYEAARIVVMKTSKTGEIEDLFIRGGSNERHELNDLAPSGDNGYLLAGSKRNINTPSNVSEIYVEKKGGANEWVFYKGDGSNFYNGASVARGVTETSNGDIFIVGNYSGAGGDSFSSSLGRASLIKLNQQGQEQWAQGYPKNSNDVISTSDGNLAFTGSRNFQLKLVHLSTEKLEGGCTSTANGFVLLGEWKGSQYYISDDEMTWENARNFSEDTEGYLAVIESEEENNIVQSYIDEIVFIGLSDNSEEGVWSWANGEPVNYTNLSSCSFCGLNSDERDFGTMLPWDGSWSFDNQWVNRRFIMEKKCGSSSAIAVDCSIDLTFINTSGFGTILNWEIPTATSTCGNGNLVVEQIAGPSRNGNYFAVDEIVTYLFIDECGNMETCSFNVEVKSGDPCPEEIFGYKYLGTNGFKKFFVSNTRVAPNAMGDLNLPEFAKFASLQDPGDLQIILSGLDEMTYIGMNDADSEGDLVWTNGELVDYTNFDICNNCADNSDDNDYVIMNHWNGGWSWSNLYAERKYVIEFSCSDFYTLAESPEDDIIQTKSKTIKDITENSSFIVNSIYPNPSQDFIFIKTQNTKGTNLDLRIVNAQGQVVLTKNISLLEGENINQFDISSLEKGMYFLQSPQVDFSMSKMRFVKM